ncbi:uncharacterized protein LY89DRAFT_294369 [Mollisia scopiformis]|uniref:BZIP domain-containing protein n=1 Tax=Mollisia scopiformis TaxID=149040 RepID=A0A194XQ10_MOLSC|nr:uncharacterized protein LY89DRAFT_294369 [Mollisia scopiformis]KUJ22345.1 hypothetical protein LY89DRAFT_294369 [Mollisia scopiformis]
MASSVLSSPSIQDLPPHEDAPPKKRARGRPLKNPGQSNIPEERRQQVRKAQEAFRQRKQAAVKSLEQRAEALEDCVEEISKVFLSFSESMLKTQMVQRDPEIGRSLLSTTSKIIDLARIAVAENEELEPKIDGSISRQLSVTKDRQSSLSAMDLPHVRLPDISRPSNFFGNGWFDYEPHGLLRLPEGNQDLSMPPLGFGMHLIRTNLQVAYFALMDDSGTQNPLVMQMFKYAFLYHTRHEIMANLRWFLEHGMQAQRWLGRAVFGFDSTLSLQHFNVVQREFRPKILHPLVDAQALLGADYASTSSPFLNAFDVEEYLITKGAYHIDNEIIHLQTCTCKLEHTMNSRCRSDQLHTLQSASTPNDPSVSTYSSEVYEIGPWTTTSAALFPDALDESENLPTDTPLDDSSKPVVDSRGKPCEVFDFNALLKDENHQSIMQDENDQDQREESCERGQIVSLSVPLLLDNLIRNSLCLGTGPGYPRNSIDVAIQSSMHPPMP